MLGKLFNKGTAEENFWNWFVENSRQIASIPDGNVEIGKELLKKIKSYNKNLTYEIVKGASGFEFVISCDGEREQIPFANILANTAPEIEGWKVVLFRRKKSINKKITHQGLEMAPDDILVEYTLYKDEIHLRLYIRNYYQGDDRYRALADKFLERTLGEFDVMTKVGAIEYVADKSDMSDVEVISLAQLREVVQDSLR